MSNPKPIDDRPPWGWFDWLVLVLGAALLVSGLGCADPMAPDPCTIRTDTTTITRVEGVGSAVAFIEQHWAVCPSPIPEGWVRV